MVTSGTKLPLGPETAAFALAAFMPFIFVVEGFSDTSCSTFVRKYDNFKFGFMAVTGDGITFGAIGAPANFNKLFLRD